MPCLAGDLGLASLNSWECLQRQITIAFPCPKRWGWISACCCSVLCIMHSRGGRFAADLVQDSRVRCSCCFVDGHCIGDTLAMQRSLCRRNPSQVQESHWEELGMMLFKLHYISRSPGSVCLEMPGFPEAHLHLCLIRPLSPPVAQAAGASQTSPCERSAGETRGRRLALNSHLFNVKYLQ